MISLAFAGVVAALTVQATPGVEALRPAFGNTLVSIYPDGRRAHLWLAPDGTYTGRGRTGGRSTGVWEVDDGEVCMRQRRPIPVPVRFCTPIVRGGVGTRWTAKAVTGETITVELAAGRNS